MKIYDFWKSGITMTTTGNDGNGSGLLGSCLLSDRYYRTGLFIWSLFKFSSIEHFYQFAVHPDDFVGSGLLGSKSSPRQIGDSGFEVYPGIVRVPFALYPDYDRDS